VGVGRPQPLISGSRPASNRGRHTGRLIALLMGPRVFRAGTQSEPRAINNASVRRDILDLDDRRFACRYEAGFESFQPPREKLSFDNVLDAASLRLNRCRKTSRKGHTGEILRRQRDIDLDASKRLETPTRL
jgi:hypothetical protein